MPDNIQNNNNNDPRNKKENLVNRRGITRNLPVTPRVTPTPVRPYNTGSPYVRTARDMWNDALAGEDTYTRIAPIDTKNIYQGTRYDTVLPGTDFEEMHGQQQGSGQKWLNASAKMVGTAATTFMTGTAGLIYGIGDAIVNQRLASVVDNDVTRAMDNISKSMDDSLPNYYTKRETEADWYSTDNILTANFWSDKVLKNLGFSLGTIAGGVAWGSVFRSIGMTNKIVRWGKGNDLAAAVEKRLASAPASGKYSAFQTVLGEVAANTKMPFASVAKNADRILISVMGTAGEATIEGIQVMTELKKNLLDEFKLSHGRMPSNLELKVINSTVENAGLYVYGMNGLILTVTNYIQLPKILGSSRRADKALINTIRRNADAKLWEAAIPKGFPGKILGVTRHAGRLLFAPVEAVEEGLQFAASTGVEDFYTRGPENKEDALELLSTVDNMSQNVFSNVFTHGLHETFNTKEGMESMLIGALSGGIQQSGIIGTYRGKDGKTKIGIGKSGNIGEYGLFGQRGTRGKNTAQAIKDLNVLDIEEALRDGVNFMGVGIGSQDLRKQAIINDDVVAEKDAEQDYALSYLIPRIKYNKLASVVEELTNYKTQAMNPNGFEELITEGIANQNETADEFVIRVDNLLESVQNTNKMYSLLNDRYENVIDDKGNALFTSEVIDKLVYAAAKIENYDNRIEDLNNSLLSTGIDLSKINESIANNTKLTIQDIEEVAATANNIKITEQETFAIELLDYTELLLRRKKYAEEYQQIKGSPVEHQAPPKAPEYTEFEEVEENNIIIKTSSGEKKYNTKDIYYKGNVSSENVKSGAKLSAPMITIIGENEDGTIKIVDSNGDKKDITVEELESYNLGSIFNVKDNKKGEYYVDNWNTPYIFNFGDKDGVKQGRIVYNETDDKMHFIYVDASGNTREIEVTNDQFRSKKGNAPQIQRVEPANRSQDVIEQRFLAAKDERKDKKHEDRLKVLGKFLEDINERHVAEKKVLATRKKNIVRTKKTLELLHEELVKHKDKRTKNLNYTKAGKAILANIRRLEKDLFALETLLVEDINEIDEIGVTLAYVEDLIDNIDNFSTDFKTFIADLKKDKTHLVELHKITENNIKSLKNLIKSVKDFIQSSKDILNDLLGQLGAAFPSISNEGVIMSDAITVEDYFTDLTPLAVGTEATETLAFAGVTLTGIQPKLAQLKKLDKELAQVEDDFSKMENDIIARQAVLDKFGAVQELWEKTIKEENIILINPEISDDIEDSQSKSVVQQDVVKEGWEIEPRKADLIIPTAGIAPVRSTTNPVGEYADRAQKFGNAFYRLLDEGKEFRGRIVTLANEHLIMRGLTKHLAGGSGIDYSKTIVIVVTDKNGNSVDELGNRIDNKDELLDKGIYQTMPREQLKQRGKTMFRASTPLEERQRIEDLYIKWRDITLKQTKLQPLRELGASFGLLEQIVILSDEFDKGGKTKVDIAASFIARTSVDSTGLVKNSELQDGDVIEVPTKNTSISRGTVTINTPLGHVFLKAPGGFIKLYNKKNDKKQAELLYDVLHLITKNILRDKNGKGADTQELFKWLRSVVYWGRAENEETGEMKDPTDGMMWYEVSNVGEGTAHERKLRIGKTSKFDFTPSSLEANRDAIILLLQETYNNTHAPFVAEGTYTVAYHQITSVNENGTTEGITWDNYQSYLIADVYPDSKNRKLEDIPLKTKVRPLEGEDDINRHGIYFYLVDDADYIKPAPKEVIKVVPTKTGTKVVITPKYNFNGVAFNTVDLGGLGEATVVLNMPKAVEEFNKREGKIAMGEDLQQFTLTMLNKKIITITLGRDVVEKLVSEGISKSIEAAQSDGRQVVVNKLATQITKAANDVAIKSAPQPKSKVISLQVEKERQKAENKLKTLGKVKIGRYEGIDKERLSKGKEGIALELQDALSKNTSWTRGNLSKKQLEAVRNSLDLFYKAIGINELENLIQRENEIGGVKEIIPIITEYINKYNFKNIKTKSKKVIHKLDGSDEILVIGKNKIPFRLKKEPVIQALVQDSEVISDAVKRSDLLTKLIKNKDLEVMPSAALLEKTKDAYGTGDAAINMFADAVLKRVVPQISAEMWEEAQKDDKDKDKDDNRFDSIDDDDVPFRMKLEKQLEPFKEENWEKVSNWVVKNFPNIPIYRIKNIIQATNGRQAYGLYRQGAAYVYKQAETGTIYHEVFHAVWDMFVDIKERKEVRREFRDRKGTYEDRFTGKVIKYIEASDHEMNEELAEEFRDKILYDKDPERVSKSWIRRLFDDLINFFNEFFFGTEATNNTNKLFNKMGNGDFAAYIPHENTLRKTEPQIIDIEDVIVREGDELRPITTARLSGINAIQEHEIYQHMTYKAVTRMFRTDEGLFAMKDKLSVSDLYEDIKEDLLGDNGIIEERKHHYNRIGILDISQRPAILKKISDYSDLKKAIEYNWEDIKSRHMDSLETYDIIFDEEENLIINEENLNKSDAMDSNKIDSFRKASSAIKLLFATLPDGELKPGTVKASSKMSSIGGVTFEQSDKIYITLLNKLHDSRNIDDMLSKLKDMAKDLEKGYPYERLYGRLTKERIYTDDVKSTPINVKKMSTSSLTLLGGFWKVMKKQNPDVPIVFILPGGDIVIGDTSLSNSSKQSRFEMVQNIIASIKEDAEENAKLYTVTATGLYNPTKALKNVTLNSNKPEEYIRFLKAFGIHFEQKDINKLTIDQKAVFRGATEGLLADLSSREDIFYWNITTMNSASNLLKLGSIKAIIENPIFESTYFSIKGERTQNFIGPNAVSNLFHALAPLKNNKELRGTRYEYLLDDKFSQGSVLMFRLFNPITGKRKKNTQDIFKTIYIGGTINEISGKRIQSSRLKYGERLAQEINLNLEGIYANLVPGDSELEWALKMHSKKTPFVSLGSISRKEYQKVFKDYFIDEINLSRDNRIVAKDRNAKDLRFFKDILQDSDPILYDTIQSTSKNISAEEVYEDNKAAIKATVEKFIVNDAKDTETLLKSYKIIRKKLDGNYTHELAFEEKILSPTQMADQIKMLTVNYMIANIEQHKMLYSDPYQYADELKRIKNFNSPRQALLHGSKKFSEAFHEIYNKGYKEGDLGYSNMNRETFRTVTLQDVWSVMPSDLADDYPGYVNPANKEAWEETDGAGLIGMQANRIFRLRISDWSPSNEEQYRYDIQYQEKVMEINAATPTERTVLLSAFKKFKDSRTKHDKSTYTPIKPIVTGNKANGRDFNDQLLDKYALFPLSFRVFYEMDPKSNILKFTEKMRKENIDYAIYGSGRKVGIELTYPLYVDGKLNTKEFQPQEERDMLAKNNSKERSLLHITEVPFSIMSLQTEVPSKINNKVTQGSQITKLATLDLMNGGVPIDFVPLNKKDEPLTDFDDIAIEWIKLNTIEAKENASPLFKEIQHNKKLLQERIKLGYEDLLHKLGLVDNEGTYTIADSEKLIKTIETEIFKQQKNNNLIAAFEGVRNGDAIIEATPVYQQIRNILFSIANSNVVRPKITGGMKVQMPSTLFESENRIKTAVIDGKEYLHSDVLKFYEAETNKDGKIVKVYTAEIMVGRWFHSKKSDKELLKWLNDTPEGQKLLKGVAFRTPTQKQNSIEAFVIKNFLPEEYGDSVVVPSALVRKTGSDFDIDKLSVYLKNTFYNGKNPEIVPFFGFQSEIDAKTKYKEIFLKRNKEWLEFATIDKDIVFTNKRRMSMIAEGDATAEQKARWVPIILKFLNPLDGNLTPQNILDYLERRVEGSEKRIQDLNDKQLDEQLASDFADTIYAEAVENEYIESLERLITHPLNYHSLVKPNSAVTMQELTDRINTKKKIDDIDFTSAGFMLSRKKMSGLRRDFVGGKRAIGIAAVGQTNHSNNQGADTYVDTSRIGTGIISDEDEYWLRGMRIKSQLSDADVKFQRYNKKIVAGRPMASLARVKNAAGEFISDIVGMFIDGYVDISNGPWIMQMGATPETAGTWLYLLKIGVPKEIVAYFMNQPIIIELLFDLELEGKTWLYNRKRILDLKKSYNAIGEEVIMIPSEEELFTMIGEENLTPLQKKQQQFILIEFLKYSKQSEHLFLVTQGTNFDTATLNDPFLVFKKKIQLKLARKTIISSADKILEASFLKELEGTMDKIRESFSMIFISDKNNIDNYNNTPRRVLEQVLTPYINMSDREFVAISQKVVADFFDWSMQIDPRGKVSINKAIAKTLLGTETEDSAAKQIRDFKESILGRDANANLGIEAIAPQIEHPLFNNMLLESFIFVPGAREGIPDNITIKGKDNKTYDQNKTINSFEEIKDYLSAISHTNNKYAGLYSKMIRLAVLQSGLSTSPVSFTKLLPYTDFKNVYNDTLSVLESFPNMGNYAELNVFERNNWNKGDWVTTINKELNGENNYGELYSYDDSNVDVRLARASTKKEIPKVIFISESNPRASEVIVYKWSTYITQEERIKRAKTGDTRHLKSQLMKKVYLEKGRDIDPIPLIQIHKGKSGDYRGFVYIAINAWGDSFRAQEFYDYKSIINRHGEVVPRVPSSVLDNGFEKVPVEVSDEKIIQVLSRKIVVSRTKVKPKEKKIETKTEETTSDFETPTKTLNLDNVSLDKSTGILTIEGEEFPYSAGYTDFIAAGYTMDQTDQLIERICKL